MGMTERCACGSRAVARNARPHREKVGVGRIGDLVWRVRASARTAGQLMLGPCCNYYISLAEMTCAIVLTWQDRHGVIGVGWV